MRKTKIICTMGPATDDIEVLRAMARAGMNVARFNFSHGSHEEHKQRIDRVKAVREEYNLPIALLLDTKGTEIRTGDMPVLVRRIRFLSRIRICIRMYRLAPAF